MCTSLFVVMVSTRIFDFRMIHMPFLPFSSLSLLKTLLEVEAAEGLLLGNPGEK